MERGGSPAETLGIDRARTFAERQAVRQHAGFTAAYPIAEIAVRAQASNLVWHQVADIVRTAEMCRGAGCTRKDMNDGLLVGATGIDRVEGRIGHAERLGVRRRNVDQIVVDGGNQQVVARRGRFPGHHRQPPVGPHSRLSGTQRANRIRQIVSGDRRKVGGVFEPRRPQIRIDVEDRRCACRDGEDEMHRGDFLERILRALNGFVIIDVVDVDFAVGILPHLGMVAILIIYMILACLYESFLHPLTIIAGLPSAAFGGLLVLWVMGYSLDLYGFVGLFMLIGIVKKNAIMVVDFALEAEAKGKSPLDAAIEGSIVRFRPIMMTTIAAIAGMTPIAIGFGAEGESRQPLGLAVAGGLLLSQFVTLYLTPVVYSYLGNLQHWLNRRNKKKRELLGIPS